jgi:hypothetical protein
MDDAGASPHLHDHTSLEEEAPMAKATKSKRKTPARTKGKKARAAAGSTVMAWQDDPESKLSAIAQPVPNLSKAPLGFRIKGPAVKAGSYQTGTPQFRYWNAASALRRGGDFWAPLLGVSGWEPGGLLPVGLDEGVDFNAFYDRTQLAFFHDSARGKIVFSGESPDVVCHEMGHACLDAHRPELWDAPFIEAGSFHESFGDTSAILSALQLKDVRVAALNGVRQDKPSQLSRLAEQLGAAIRESAPSAVDPDCLRNACNNFEYVDPQTLPDSAPATELCAEVHSFSRVFTGAFYDILSGMLKIRSKSPTEADLAAVATDYAKLLVDATAAAPVQPNYFAQVAAHLIDADTAKFGGKYRNALVTAFVDRKIIPQSAVQSLVAFRGKVPKAAFGVVAAADRPGKPQIRKVHLSASDFGMKETRPLVVDAPVEHKPVLMVSAAMLHRHTELDDHVQQATHRFVKMLFARDRVDTQTRSRKLAVSPTARRHHRHTHVLLESAEGLRLVRRLFHCGRCC